MASNVYADMTELIRDYYDMPVADYLNKTVTINEVSLSCDIYRVAPETVLTSSVFTGCTAVDGNTQIIIGRDMSVASGTTLTPPYRCKGIVIGDVGTFTNEGTISMTARGAIGAGKNIQLTADYMISATGGTGGEGVIASSSDTHANGNNGNSPASGVLSCGGGGSGSRTGKNHNLLSGAGGTGTSFSGGSGGGGMSTYYDGSYVSPNASNIGGAGGNGTLSGYSASVDKAAATGGAGNPAGTNALHRYTSENIDVHNHVGTGGLLVILASSLVSSGSIVSEGSQADGLKTVGSYIGIGGSSGGGCIVLLSKEANVTGTHSTSGGILSSAYNYSGGISVSGGAGGAGAYLQQTLDDLVLVNLPVEFAVTDTAHLDNIDPSEAVRFIGLTDDDELYYDIMGKRHNSGSGHIVEDEEGTSLTKRKVLTINSPLTVEDDDENEKTVIGADTSGALDLSKIIPPGTEHNATDGSPVGTIINFFGYTAPSGYLVCDGTEYAKADYPYLATHLADLDNHYSTTQYVGSDSDHFKVPDLRGEFLRGTGTNSHENQGNGANVGVHQDSTEIAANILGNTIESKAVMGEARSIINYDTDIKTATGKYVGTESIQTDSTGTFTAYRTVRPTNTSVLYCIKYN